MSLEENLRASVLIPALGTDSERLVTTPGDDAGILTASPEWDEEIACSWG